MTNPAKYWRHQPSLSRGIGQTGEIISCTLIRVAPAGFTDQAPYPVALVKLSDGSVITAQVVDYHSRQLHSGQPVVCVIRRLFQPGPDEVISYGIKVKPI